MKRIPIILPFLTIAALLFVLARASSLQEGGHRPLPFQSQLPLNPLVEEMVSMVSEDELLNNLEALVGFYTRHTSSDTTSPDTGIGAARNFIFDKFKEYAQAGGGSMEASFFVFSATVCDVFNSAHKNVLATIPGTSTPERTFIASGHMDNRTVDRCDYTSFAPGANDDGSGTVVSMELARILGQFTDELESTVILMTVTGEDEGLFGSIAYADWALENNLDIDGMVTNDVVGNIEGCVDPACPPGEEIIIDSTSVRHFSGEPSTSTSRQLSRYMKLKGERYVTGVYWTINLIPDIDRPGRGGDHMPFYFNGYPAVRFTEPHEFGDGTGQNGRQHNEMDLVEFMNMPYLARIVQTNIAGLATLAMAPDRPTGLQAEDMKTGSEIQLSWPGSNTEPDFAGYRVAYRVTFPEESLFYDGIIDVGNVNQYTLSGLKPNVPLSISISAYDTVGNESVFSDEVLVTPTVAKSISVSPTYASPGLDSVVISAHVISETEGLTLLAEIELSDGTVLDSLLLLDDGDHGDGPAGDSLYANVWAVPAETERNYFVSLNITVPSADTVITSHLSEVAVFTSIGPVLSSGIVNVGTDTIPDPGEIVLFLVPLANEGDITAALSVEADFTVDHLCVEALNPTTLFYGDIPAGEAMTPSSALVLRVSEDCAPGTDIPIGMNIVSESYHLWNDTLKIHIYGVGISDENESLPDRFALYPNIPNPFNAVTTLGYDLPERTDVILTIYDILGRELRTLVQGVEEPGTRSVVWDGTDEKGEPVSSGVYLFRIQAEDPYPDSLPGKVFTQTRKMALMR